MCGIYGALLPRSDLGRTMSAMQDLLRHRGPDAAGLEKVPGGLLGHLRLSIIDLSAAASQPLWDAGRRACISFNGEIYNYRELREECRRAGMEFRSASDTEVIVNQYLLHGEASFDKLNGIFAFCLFDARSGDFFLVRDPMGVKPLYYARTEEAIFFASELKALIRTGAVPAEVDPAALQAYLQLDFVPAPLAMVRGVSKLREGHLLHVRPSGEAAVRAYASLQEEPEAPRKATPFASDVAEFDRLIHGAVERQLVSDVPLGVFLSGGIDSSIVAQAAVEVSGSRVSTFSIGFEDRSFDESSFFDEVAGAIGSDHHTEVLRPGAMLDLIPSLPQIACEPLADGSIFPTTLLCRFARRHVTVALSGDGADELLAGYPTYHAARLARPLRALPPAAARGLAGLARAVLPVNYDNLSPDFKVKKFLDGLDPDPILRNARWLGSFRREDLPGLMQSYDEAPQRDLERMLHEPALKIPRAPMLEKLLRMDQRFYLGDGVLVKVDRASMSCSLEVRVPFLDPGIVAFARSLPGDRKLAGGDFKHLLKAYASGRLPAPVLSRPKKGFGTPLGKWFRKELKGLLGDVLSPRRVEQQGFFRGRSVARLLEEHWSGRRDNRKLLFNLLSFTLWRDALGDAAPPVRGR
jgi:asparagine synthase (glutamine-hydrolysing)